MTSSTELLRRLLDERGVEWWNDTDPEPQRQTNVWIGERLVMFHENANGTVGYVVYSTHDLTPEQAIAATLGRGTCHNSAPSYLDFLCSECGFVHYHSDENDSGDGNEWRYCPNCGRKVVSE